MNYVKDEFYEFLENYNFNYSFDYDKDLLIVHDGKSKVLIHFADEPPGFENFEDEAGETTWYVNEKNYRRKMRDLEFCQNLNKRKWHTQ